MLKIIEVTKSFASKKAVDTINISLDKMECLCLLGPNGAGKSTILNITMGLLMPDKGEVYINGMKFYRQSKNIYQIIGCMPEKSILINDISGLDFLKFHGLLYSINKDKLERRIGDLIEYFFDDTEDIYKKISLYSKGMKRRLEICASLLHAPEILILDEPFSGLDPITSYKLTIFLNKYRANGKSVLLSSHDLLFIKEIATHISFIYEGNIKFNGKTDEFFNTKMSNLESFLNYLPLKENNEAFSNKIPDWLCG